MKNIEIERAFMSKLDSFSDEELKERVENAPPTGLGRCFTPDSLKEITGLDQTTGRYDELSNPMIKTNMSNSMVFVGSHQEWRRIKTKIGSRRVKYVVVTCNQYVQSICARK
jgi:hypothetical protein